MFQSSQSVRQSCRAIGLAMSVAMVSVATADSVVHSLPTTNNVAKQVVAQLNDAWNRGDASAWAAPYAEDAEFINILGSVFSGKAAIRTRHAEIFDRAFRGSTMKATVRQVRMLGATVMVVDSDTEVRNFRQLPPNVLPTSNGVLRTRLKHVLEKRGSLWQIVASQNTDVKPLPTMTLRSRH